LEKKNLTGTGVSNENSIRLTFDASFPEHGLFSLVGFYLGDSALQWADRTEEERKQEAIRYYCKIFGEIARNPTHYVENNWVNEPYIRGAYMSIPAPTILTRVGPAVIQPIGNIHFAGSETATEWSGYMEGALQSAERVVEELIEIKKNTHSINQPILFNQNRKPRSFYTDKSTGNFSVFRTSLYVVALAVIPYMLWKFYN